MVALSQLFDPQIIALHSMRILWRAWNWLACLMVLFDLLHKLCSFAFELLVKLGPIDLPWWLPEYGA